MINKLLIALFLLPTLLIAQDESSESSGGGSGGSGILSKIQVGAKIGGNYADTRQSGTTYFVSSPVGGFHLGGYGEYAVTDKISARLEALYSTRGMRLGEFVNGTRINHDLQSAYLDIPITGSYNNVWKTLSVHAGVVGSVFLYEFRAINTNSEGLKVPASDEFKLYERLVFGICGGASYQVTLLDQNIEVGARYNLGLTRTNELIREVRASRNPKYWMAQIYVAYKIFQF